LPSPSHVEDVFGVCYNCFASKKVARIEVWRVVKTNLKLLMNGDEKA